MNLDLVLGAIRKERERQNDKWGQQDHNLPEWMAILMEEVGEASKEAVDFHHKNDPGFTRLDVRQEGRLKNFRKEMIQVAAVAVQIVECVDRNWDSFLLAHQGMKDKG